MNEETILESPNNKKPLKDDKKQIKQESTNKKKKVGTAGIAGIAGVAGFSAGIMTPVDVYAENADNTDDEILNEVASETEIPPTDGEEIHEWHEISVATNVNDSMSFNEAFAAARHEVGAGGVFEWHGHAYNTYYSEEWNAMSQEEKDDYLSDVNHTLSHNPNDHEIPNDDNNGEAFGDEVPDPDENDTIEPNQDEELYSVEAEPTDEVEPIDPDTIDELEPTDELGPIDAVDPEVEVDSINVLDSGDEVNPIDEVNSIDELDPMEEIDPIGTNDINDQDFEPEDFLDNENPDIDEFAFDDFEPGVTIDNDMNMDEFV